MRGLFLFDNKLIDNSLIENNFINNMIDNSSMAPFSDPSYHNYKKLSMFKHQVQTPFSDPIQQSV